SVFIASILVAIQLALSGTVPFNVGISAMAFWHILIGIGEALITLSVVSFVWRTRPDLLYSPTNKSKLVHSRTLVQR
ncbi:MAG: energy-coupling factor ABC transporter permease, partial [Waterburya sp.]